MTGTILALDVSFRKATASVTVLSRGCIMAASAGQASSKKLNSGGLRGAVRGFSYASRRRMRHFLMTRDFQPGFLTFNVTFTLPTTDIESQEEARIFANWSRQAVKDGWSAVWRLQVQKRGVRHWHLLVGIPASVAVTLYRQVFPLPPPVHFKGGAAAKPPAERVLWHLMRLHISESWKAACDSLGDVGIKIGEDASGRNLIGRGLVSHAVGFDKYAVDVRGEHDDRTDYTKGKSGSEGGAWCRYLCDHSTRSAQEAVGKGRQWGVVGRKGFLSVLPDDVVKLTDRQYACFRRAFERLATASRPCVSAPFGSHLGRRVKRGRRGRAVSFCRPETIKRLLTWAVETDTPF